MKRSISLLLVIIMLLTLVSCGGSGSGSKNGKTTLMVYMIGSDLESKSGSATDDLIEIQDSGIDLNKNNVVIYTGGSSEWQNDRVSGEKNSILTLTNDGYVTEETYAQKSMGEADTLSSFLDYCVKNHAADHYALILWNHGNGPLIGYGKDCLFENDSLSLSEMAKAMESSSFNESNQLDWVGFDACLMASAELACIWEPYAKYLVSSQEIEPAFGWNYSFLKNFGKTGDTELLSSVTENYLTACEDYYQQKGYEDRDITLSCVDLSCASQLEEALNGLFEAAGEDVGSHFDALSAMRVKTRALGRASTGSEYDLVDLKDMSAQFEKDYPDESAQLSDIIDKMVICNSTNAENLCGMSLYYPFYNKSYYEDSWWETYREMGVFSSYIKYLSEYQTKWLGHDMQDAYAVSKMPTAESESVYSLELTEEQEQHFASAKYYIMRKEGKETFAKVYSSSDVTLENGKLISNFDGNVIYAHNDIDDYLLPVTTEYDTVGNNTNYSVKLQLDSSQGGSFLTANIGGEDQDVQFLNCRYLIAANKKDNSIAISALMPYDTEQSGTDLLSGKTEELDISDFTTYLFMEEDKLTVTRTDNGIVKEIDEWLPSDSHLWSEWSIADGLDFVYAPLGYGEYSMFFEICDTQGNLYCSEPIDIDTSKVDWLKHEEQKTTKVESNGNYPLLLKEDDSMAIYLDKIEDDGREHLTLLAENKSDKKLKYVTEQLCCNDNISCSDGSGPYGVIDAGKKERPYTDVSDYIDTDIDIEPTPITFDFGAAQSTGAVKKLTSLQFDLKVTGYEDKKTVWKKETIVVDFKEGSEFKLEPKYSLLSAPILDQELEPVFGAVVKPQTVADNDQFKAELLCFGMNDSKENINIVYRITNKSEDNNLCIASDGLAIDDIYLEKSMQLEIPPKMSEYRSLLLYDLEESHITGMQKLTASFRTGATSYIVWQGYGDVGWYDVKLDKKSDSPSTFDSGSEVLLDENNVKVSLVDFSKNDYDDGKKWTLALECGGEEGAELQMIDLEVNGTKFENNYDWTPVYLYRAHTGPKQKSYFTISTAELSSSIAPKDVKNVSFRFAVYNFTGDKLLFESKDTVKLQAK